MQSPCHLARMRRCAASRHADQAGSLWLELVMIALDRLHVKANDDISPHERRTLFEISGGPPMNYSIWSKGRLVGHTDLEYNFRKNGFRTGWFYPNELGAKLMPMATGVGPAMRTSVEAGRNLLSDPDVISAVRYAQGLELELRGPDGKTIETRWVSITDTDYLLSIADLPNGDDSVEPLDCKHELTDEVDSEVGDVCLADDEEDEPWREAEESPRYQIQVFLVDHEAVPQ